MPLVNTNNGLIPYYAPGSTSENVIVGTTILPNGTFLQGVIIAITRTDN